MCYGHCCGCFFCDGCDQTTTDLVKISDCVKVVSYCNCHDYGLVTIRVCL